MVLAAASQAERQEQGRYWYTHQRTAFPAFALGKGGGYVVEERYEYFHWTGRARDDGQAFFGRDFAGAPQTEGDVEAWREAGSPEKWKIRSSGLTRTVGSKSGEWEADSPKDEGGVFNIPGIGAYTYAELQKFPTEPAELREVLCEGRVRLMPEVAKQLRRGGLGAAPKRCDKASQVLNKVFFTLHETPVPPKVRAGLMRLLADYPGVRRLGTVTDSIGRSGVGLAASFEAADGRGTIQRDLVFDQETGAVLGSRDTMVKPGPKAQEWQVPGRVVNDWLVLGSGWTDTKPGLPE
ncbi:hypothetical protein SAMN05444920_102806 [Nonomuraea solani]|uniref:Uncharacterized protein n=2 Tax=Nonomuraea solani TaxID=1144553 RepID=A0A1H5ZQ99_9ACTN|nr:hypothetical protein SAMN05444920_102806 [Nonomuraea solani]